MQVWEKVKQLAHKDFGEYRHDTKQEIERLLYVNHIRPHDIEQEFNIIGIDKMTKEVCCKCKDCGDCITIYLNKEL